MKKVFYLTAMLAALILGATSCKSTEEDDQLRVSTVTFSMNTLGANGSMISDGTTVDQLVFSVYDANGNRVQIENEDVVVRNNVTFPTTETFRLVKGQSYKVVFWAQSSQTNAYDISNFPEVAVDYNGYNNDEARDAFYAVKDFTVGSVQAIDVELTRPFAQVNVGITKADWYAAVGLGKVISESSIVMKNAATNIDLMTGITSGDEEVSYVSSAKPAEPLFVDKDGDGVREEEFIYLSMSYILVNDGSQTGTEKATLDEVIITLTDQNGEETVISEGLTNVPVQRNWRTNILGEMLTTSVIFNISIDPNYIDERNIYLPEYQALSKAFAEGGYIEVHKDLIFDDQASLLIPAGVEVELDMNDFQLINSVNKGPAIKNYGKLTILNGTFDNQAGDNGVSTQGVILNSGELIIEGGTFGSDNTFGNAIENRADGNVTINGGTFTASSRKVNPDGKPFAYVFNHRSAGTMTINDATVNTEANGVFSTYYTTGYTTGELIVNGGTYQLNGAADCKSHYMVYCPYGTVTLNGGDYTWYKGASSNSVYIEGSGVVNVDPACNRYGDAGWLNY